VEEIFCVCVCCRVSFIFGVVTCLAGFSGVAIGMFAAKRLRPLTACADPIVCAFGLITGAPFLLLSLVLSRYHSIITWVSYSFLLSFFCRVHYNAVVMLLSSVKLNTFQQGQKNCCRV